MKVVKWAIDIALVLLLAFLSAMTILPKETAMPDTVMMASYVITLALVAMFLAFIWRDRPADEREVELQARASRWAYLVGVAVLVAALVYQGFHHDVDAAIPVALLAMVSVKVLFYATSR